MRLHIRLCLVAVLSLVTTSASAKSLLALADSTFAANAIRVDSTKDSLPIDLSSKGLTVGRHRPHIFALTELENGRQQIYHEAPSMLDFNRVTGFFLGVATGGMEDFGPHDELGVSLGTGYGFASKRWEYQLALETRLPLVGLDKLRNDSTFRGHLLMPPTLALGGEIHNITSTSDQWRSSRLENAATAFLAREDFRDYYKLAGWDGYLAFRPRRNYELRAEWRSDHYESLSQTVFYGRWGGNKVLPPNPAVGEGRMNSIVFSSQHEGVGTRYALGFDLSGDTVPLHQLKGVSTLFQMEFGHMPGSDFGFNRYLLDTRHFLPIFRGLNFDSRFRFEAETGDVPFQKASFVGGPGTLPGIYRKDMIGNRMLLFNTELRFSLELLSKLLYSPDLNFVIYNDFARLGTAEDGQSIFKGFGFAGASSILYNVGVGLGWTHGIQFGIIWRTDIHDTPRVMFRLERPF